MTLNVSIKARLAALLDPLVCLVIDHNNQSITLSQLVSFASYSLYRSKPTNRLPSMLVKQFLVAALFTISSVTALPEANPGNAMTGDRRCNNDR